MSTDDAFLDLACLTYRGDDAPERRARARVWLDERPKGSHRSLHVAAATGDAGSIARCLAGDAAAVHATDSCGRTPLLCLCLSRVKEPAADWLGSVEALLAAGADPRASIKIGDSTFRCVTGAVGLGEGPRSLHPPHPVAESIVQRLLQAGANPNDPQAVYNAMLHPEGTRWLALLIEAGLGPTHPIDWDMGLAEAPRTLDFALTHAAGQGDAERVTLLLRAGASAAAISPYDGRPAVLGAALSGAQDAVRLLVDAGAPAPSDCAAAPGDRLLLAVLSGDLGAAQNIVDASPAALTDASVLCDASGKGQTGVVSKLLSLGAPPNGRDRSGATALHRAAFGGHSETARALVAAGADPSLKDLAHGSTAPGWASYAGHTELARELAS